MVSKMDSLLMYPGTHQGPFHHGRKPRISFTNDSALGRSAALRASRAERDREVDTASGHG